MRRRIRFDRGRRTLLTGGTAMVLASTVLARRSRASGRTLYINSWGGSHLAAQEAAYFRPFTAATGIEIRTVSPVSFARIKAQVRAGSYEFDLTQINSSQWLRAARDGLAEPIDWSILKKEALPPGAVVAEGYGIAQNVQGTNLCYRSDRFPNGGPKSWADFWDVERFPGSRALCLGDPVRNVIFALLADGVPPDRLYPLDIDRAFRKLEQLKPHIKAWWKEGNQSQQLLRDGEVDMMSIWNARATELKQQGVPVELVWNGAVRTISTWGVLKGAPNRDLAWEFLNFAEQAKPQAMFNTRLFYGPINPDAFALIPREIAVQLPTYAENQRVSVAEDVLWEVDRLSMIEERFTQWLAS